MKELGKYISQSHQMEYEVETRVSDHEIYNDPYYDTQRWESLRLYLSSYGVKAYYVFIISPDGGSGDMFISTQEGWCQALKQFEEQFKRDLQYFDLLSKHTERLSVRPTLGGTLCNTYYSVVRQQTQTDLAVKE